VQKIYVEGAINDLERQTMAFIGRARCEKGYANSTKLLGRAGANMRLIEQLREELNGGKFCKKYRWDLEKAHRICLDDFGHYCMDFLILRIIEDMESYSIRDAMGSEPDRFSKMDVGFRFQIGHLKEKFEIRPSKR
jgi:hypothetical protein